MYGELVPVGGGDNIPLLEKRLLVGRRESCDIVLRFSNVSAHHCQLFIENGYWYVKDLESRNGTRVHGRRVDRKRLDPGCEIAFAKHKYTVEYSPADLGASGPPPPDEEMINQILGRSLLERAGLSRRDRNKDEEDDRYEATNDEAGQIEDPEAPV
ncbi:MAG: FHA domain-containing protein [Planctomycetota bacterium]|nr:FHA domain-containing protein [Planctomycetota bacterium]